MNKWMTEHGDVLKMTLALRHELFDILTDADLDKTLGGDTLSLRDLIIEYGNIEHSYAEAAKTFKQDWSYQHPNPPTTVAGLREWLADIEADLLATYEATTDAQLEQIVDREHMQIPLAVQCHIHREGLLIFYGKASIYLKALGKTYSEQWVGWVG